MSQTNDPRILETPPNPDERQWALFAHLGGLIAAAVSGTSVGFVVPLAIWLLKKDESRFIADQAKEALNFQISILIGAAGLAVVGSLIALVTCGLGALLVAPAGLALMIYAVIMPIIAVGKVNSGELYRYPLTLRLID